MEILFTVMVTSKNVFGKRFKQWRQSKGITAYRLAKLTGVHPSFISNIEAERRPMSEEFMRRIAAQPEFEITFETLRSWKAQSEYNAPELLAALGEWSEQAGNIDHIQPLDGLYRIPLKMAVSAGQLAPKSTVEEPVYIDWYGLQTLSTDLFCMQVKGDSMWPPVPDGAILLVKEVDELKSGQRYVIETKDAQMTFKLIEFDTSGANLVPLNKAYAPIPLGEAALKRLFQVLAFKVDWS
jgi:SOS-response transcriptional repressor LexA